MSAISRLVRSVPTLTGVGAVALVLACASKRSRGPDTDPPQGGEDAVMDGELPADGPLLDEATASGDANPRPDPNRPPRTIYRSEIDRALAGGPGYLLYQLSPEPFRVSGKFVGWEITQLFPDDPELCAPGCDLAIGDVILSVNGDRLETPQAFSAMLAKLPKLQTLEVHSLRNEKRRKAKYKIVSDG